MTKILQVAMSGSGSAGQPLNPQPFNEEAIYQLDDSHPKLLLGVEGKYLPKVKSEQTGFIALEPSLKDPGGLTWMSWCPLGTSTSTASAVSEERRFGYYEAMVTGSWQGRLRCYLWPAKLFDRAQLSEMIRGIADAFGRPVVWEQTNAPVRAYVTTAPGGRREMWALIDSVWMELRAVEQLHRMRMLGTQETSLGWGENLWMPGADTPEERLVALWALRRLQHLTSIRHRLDGARTRHEAALREYAGNEKKEVEHQDGLHRAREALVQVGILAARIRGIADQYSGIRAGFELVPSMQRDHRLRRLLAAFAPATQEWFAEHETQLSTLPPLKAPAIFELWGAVMLIGSLRILGWSIGPPEFPYAAEDWGHSSDDHCWWVGTKGNERIRLDFRPRLHGIDTADIPPLHERIVDSWGWGIGRLPVDFTGLVSLGQRAPDYTLRWWTEGGRAALAVGDASLADPKYQKGNKIEKAVSYRQAVAWRLSETQFVPCASAGLFLLLPGPPEQWPDTVQSDAAQQDCYLLCPTPAASHIDFTARVESLLQSLRRSRL